MIKGTAPMRCEVKWDGTSEELIDAVEDTFGELDTPDLGDAMGSIITECMLNDLEISLKWGSHTLEAAIVFDSFSWEGID
jgi:hypothetical protein